MVTDQLLITYIQQIASLFCSEANLKVICRASVKQRLVNDFSNETFSNSFLPFLSTNRFYFYSFVRVEPDNGKLKVVVDGYDVLTGKRTGHIGIGGVEPGDWDSQNYAAVFARVGWIYIDKKPSVGWLVRVPTSNTYNIVFVPGSAGSGTCSSGYVWNESLQRCLPAGTGGGGLPPGGGGIVIPSPIVPGSPVPPQAKTGINFDDYLMPALLVGGGLALYYYFKK